MWAITIWFVWSVSAYGTMHSGGGGFPIKAMCEKYGQNYVTHIRSAVRYRCYHVR